jgi:fumarate hydratase class I
MPRNLTLPLLEEEARALHVGDEVLVTGLVLTGRDAAHRHLAQRDEPRVRAVSDGALVYHCGPVVSRDARTGAWRFEAAAPTASVRSEPYQGDVLRRYGLRGAIGTGGMGLRTLEALREHGAVYLEVTGGTAVALARCVTRVAGVHLLEELGVAEAIWTVEVSGFPAVVSMDSHGESLRASRPQPPSSSS